MREAVVESVQAATEAKTAATEAKTTATESKTAAQETDKRVREEVMPMLARMELTLSQAIDENASLRKDLTASMAHAKVLEKQLARARQELVVARTRRAEDEARFDAAFLP